MTCDEADDDVRDGRQRGRHRGREGLTDFHLRHADAHDERRWRRAVARPGKREQLCGTDVVGGRARTMSGARSTAGNTCVHVGGQRLDRDLARWVVRAGVDQDDEGHAAEIEREFGRQLVNGEHFDAAEPRIIPEPRIIGEQGRRTPADPVVGAKRIAVPNDEDAPRSVAGGVPGNRNVAQRESSSSTFPSGASSWICRSI